MKKTITELVTLKDQELQSILAELDGFERDPVHHLWYGPRICGFNSKTQQIEDLPKYPEDLDACHVVEANLSPAQWPVYVRLLGAITRDHNGEGLVFASAREKTIGLISILQ